MEKIQKIMCAESKQGTRNRHTSYSSTSENNLDTSLRLIKTHSQPNLRSHVEGSQMEDIVSISSDESVELNNTFEEIDYILKHGADEKNNNPELTESDKFKSCQNTPHKDINKDEESLSKYFTPMNNFAEPFSNGDEFKTPYSTYNFATPLSNSKFKTPINPANLVQKMPAAPRTIRGKMNSYEHISSPIASYIKHSPQVPLVKDIHPTKPLPGASGIPKLAKISQIKKPKEKHNEHPASGIPKLAQISQIKKPKEKHNEHLQLPFVAYKCAKKTEVVQMPDEEKLPKSKWVNKIKSSVLKPTVMRHENRENNPKGKRLLSNQEHSFANLSLHQADVSICTQKTAFKSTNKH